MHACEPRGTGPVELKETKGLNDAREFSCVVGVLACSRTSHTCFSAVMTGPKHDVMDAKW